MAQKKQGRKPNPIAAFFGFGITSARATAARPAPAGRASVAEPAQPRYREEISGVGADAVETPVPARTFSWAHIFLLGALVFCILQVYNPLTTYIRQSNEISAVEQNIAALEAEKTELQAQINWWEDDNYVKQQARSRLFYVQPGEIPYLVVGADATSTMADDTSAAAKTAPEDSWTTKLWSSVQLSAEITDAGLEEADGEATAESTEPEASETAVFEPQPAPANGGQ